MGLERNILLASALAETHIVAQARLRTLLKALLTQAWRALPHFDRPNLDQWLSTAVPLSTAGQRQASALTNAFLARSLGRQPLAIDPPVGAAVRNGVPPEKVYERPFIVVWSALAAGKAWQEAAKMGLDRATQLIATDAQMSMRDTLVQVGEQDDTIMGYQRVADAGACAYCLELDGAQFLTSDPAPIHPSCGCGAEPVEYTRGRHFAASKIPDTVAVHDHGELGPTLGSPEDHFTSEAAIPESARAPG